MAFLLDHPEVLFAVSLLLLWVADRVGAFLYKVSPKSKQKDEELILGAILTLLALIIGFTFAMAGSRYDQRKSDEGEEANAIGIEYNRLGLLPPADAAKGRALLRDYLDWRIVYHTSRDSVRLRQAESETARLQSNLWSTVLGPAATAPPAITTLIVSGLNDVSQSEEHTEAAWLNRVPLAAWMLMFAIAIFCNMLLGYRTNPEAFVLSVVLPVALSISFFLIADIDSPRSGIIHVQAQNLERLADWLRPH